MRRMEGAVAACQRLQLSLNGDLEYKCYEDFEDDVDFVFALLEEVRDAVHPVLEERARATAKADGS